MTTDHTISAKQSMKGEIPKAGVIGFLIGGFGSLAMVWIATEFRWQFREWFDPPTGEDFQYVRVFFNVWMVRYVFCVPAFFVGGVVVMSWLVNRKK